MLIRRSLCMWGEYAMMNWFMQELKEAILSVGLQHGF